MPWRLTLSPRARKELRALSDRDRRAISAAIDRLAVDFGAAEVTKLGGRDDQWRLRVGRWRVLLELDNEEGLITVARVVARDHAYR